MFTNLAICLCAVGTLANPAVPDPPAYVGLSTISDTQLGVAFTPPASDGGSAVTSYKVEWDTDPGVQEIQTITTSTFTGPNEVFTITSTAPDVDEVQTITTTATHTREVQLVKTSCDPYNQLSGEFTINLDTTPTGGSVQTSGVVSYNADAAAPASRGTVKAILEAMTNIHQGVDVTRSTADSENGYTWTVTFPLSMGDVPQMSIGSLGGLGGTGANVAFSTVTEGNIIRGSFRLTFGGSTTRDIPYNALDVDVKDALEALSPVETVNVVRTGPDDQRGYEWTVTFTSDVNPGNIDPMTTVYADTLTGEGAQANVATLADGNQLGGTIGVSDGTSTETVPFDATAGEMKSGLEKLAAVGVVAVTRTGPDPELGYQWVVSFLQDEGNRAPLTAVKTGLTVSSVGDAGDVVVAEVRTGTVKEVQTIATTTTGAAVSATTKFRLEYDGQKTGLIFANSNAGNCDSSVREKQRITVTTTNIVSPQSTFKLIFEDKGMTAAIHAYPGGDNHCDVVKASIKTELEKLGGVGTVSTTVDSSDAVKKTCVIDVTFDSLSGNRIEMTVQAGDSAAAASATTGGDTVAITTITNGAVDIIKTELEMLTNIGTVTVTSAATAAQTCTWSVTFDTNAGASGAPALPLMSVAAGTSADASTYTSFGSAKSSGADTVTVAKTATVGTAEVLGGHFTVQFRGQRTGYLPFDVTEGDLQAALQGLSTVGSVEVVRDQVDENNGFTWSVSFVTDLGDLEPMVVDDRALTGTVATATVQEVVNGRLPGFSTKDPEYGLSLGSKTITSLDELSLTVSELKQGIPYYFRVTAINAVGVSGARIASPPFLLPLAQPPSAPSSVELSILNGDSLRVTTHPPLHDGGKAVDKYMVEYANEKMQDEVQSIRLQRAVTNEVQEVTTVLATTSEVQLIETVTAYSSITGAKNEKQKIVCDASGGSFTITFNGKTTQPILADATATIVKDKLQELTSITTVSVTYTGTATACTHNADETANFLTIEFIDVPGIRGELPANVMTTDVSQLQGKRRADVTVAEAGSADIEGAFRVSFRGYTTQDIAFNADAATMTARLEELNSIGSGGVTVTVATPAGGATSAKLWQVTFVGSNVGGNVEAIKVDPLYMRLMGNGAGVNVLTDADTIATGPYAAFTPTIGNEIEGYFTLTLRGHTTSAITHMASDSTMKQRLEELPNIGTVDVHRTGPNPAGAYTWTVTYVSNPGYFPAGSGDRAILVPNYLGTLVGSNSVPTAPTVTVTQTAAGSAPLSGTFALGYAQSTIASPIAADFAYTGALRNDISAAGLKVALEAINTVGRVEVERTVNSDGYTWLVTFSGCRTVNNQDVCNIGDLHNLAPKSLLTFNGQVTVSEVTPGVGPSSTETITDLSGGSPYVLDIDGLTTGSAYYVRVYAHTAVSYGVRALSFPESVTPANQPPGPCKAVALKESTGAESNKDPSITLFWEKPTRNGGSSVVGYELWMDDWAGGRSRMVFDGTDQPSKGLAADPVTIYARDDGLGVEAGRQYRFQVRAINYCHPSQPRLACHGEFSPVAIFTVRSPRVPLPPAAPTRDSTTDAGSSEITVRWTRPIDNGGSVITQYKLYWDSGTGSDQIPHLGTGVTNTIDGAVAADAVEGVVKWEGSVETSSFSNTVTLTVGADEDAGNRDDTTPQYTHTVTGLKQAHIYRFYVVAVNSQGSSGHSPILSVLVGNVPPATATPVLQDIFTTSAAVSRNLLAAGGGSGSLTALTGEVPQVSDSSVTCMTITWEEPTTNSNSPITGYKLYQFQGIAAQTAADMTPVKNEVQQVQTSVAALVKEVQVVKFVASGGHFYLRLGDIMTKKIDLSAASLDAATKTALNTALGAGTIDTVTDRKSVV